MKIAFLQITNEQNLEWIVTPWPAYLKSYAEQFIDAEWVVVNSVDDIYRESPDVLAISVVSQDWDDVSQYIFHGNKIGAKVVIGGHHVTGFNVEPQDKFDVIYGPAEVAFTNYLLNFIGDQRKLKNIEDLDEIPMPDFTFGARTGQKPTIVTSRGCPYKCTFCSQRSVYGGIKFHSPRRVIDEIKTIQREYPLLKRLSIQDDLFAANKKRILGIREIMKDEGVKIKLNSGMRSELVTDENCRLWIDIGLTSVGIGGESGSDRILKQLKGPGSSVIRNQQALTTLSRNGISAGTGIIFGAPGETENDIKETYEWLLMNYKNNTIARHVINMLTPYPGTEVWREASKSGLVGGNDFRWSQLKHQTMTYRNEETHPGRKGWFQLRRQDKTVYLNESVVPQETLFQMIDYYESKIQMCSPAQIYRGIRNRTEVIVRKHILRR